MENNFHYCELCNKGFRFGTAQALVSLHYLKPPHVYEISSKVNFLENQEAKILVLNHLKNVEEESLKNSIKKEQEDKLKPSIVVQRKCELCGQNVPEDYQGYVSHILGNHNLNAAQSELKDKYIFECVKNGQIGIKTCDICQIEVGRKVYDYIIHINLQHKPYINDNLKKYVKDPYVLSVVTNKDHTKTLSCIEVCRECGEELDFLDLEAVKKHKEIHIKFNALRNNFKNSVNVNDNINNISQNSFLNNFNDNNNLNDKFEDINKIIDQNANKNIINPYLNIDNSNKTNSKFNISDNSNNINQNEEELKKLVKEAERINLDISKLQKEQKIVEDKKNNLNLSVQKKIEEKEKLVNQIKAELESIDELETSITIFNIQIEDLKNEDASLKQKIEKLNSKSVVYKNDDEKVKELELQFNFLNQQYGVTFSDKLNEVEKELMILKANIEQKKGNSSEIKFDCPKSWTAQNEYLFVHSLNTLSEEYAQIASYFLDNFQSVDNDQLKKSKKALIISISRIQNVKIWKKYCYAKHQLILKGNSEERFLFYGSTLVDPKSIYEGKEDGFDLKLAKEGKYGLANYFYFNSRKCDDYAYATNNGTKIQILANVLVGNCVELETNLEISKLRHPPFISNTKERYDSVKGKFQDELVIYNCFRAYPHYAIEYRVI